MRDPHMATPRRNPAAAGSGDKENYLSQDQGGVNDCPKLWNGASSTKKKKKPGGFNLRKSIAWNPAFSIEEGVLDNVELSVLTGSQVKANWSPGSGVCGAISHSSRFGNSGSTSVLKEVAENSQGRKLPAKFRSADNKGRKLFSSSKDSERDASKQLVSTQDKRPARSIQKCIPRPPAGYSQKKVPNSSATFQMSIPKKSQSSLPVVSRIRSTASVTNISTPNKKLATVNTEQSRRVQRIPLRSKIEPTSVTKSSGPSIVKNVVPTINGTCEEANVSGKYKNISPYSQNSTSTSIGVRAASTFAKPSALRMPSPSVSFFTQGMAPVPHSDSAHQNTGSCFSGSTSSHVKPPRYKQPVNLKSNPCLTNQLPTNTSAASNHAAKPLTTECTLNTLVSSYSGIEHANVCFATQSLSKSTTYSAKSGNTNNQEMSEVACLLEGSATTVQTLSSQSNDGARNCTTSVYSDESCVHGPVNINDIGPIEDSRSLKDVCSSTKPTVGSTLSRCVSFEACNPSDLNCESKSNNCNSVAIELENSLLTGTPIAVSLSEVKSCTPDPDFLRDCDSCYQNNTLVVSSICADQLRQCCNSSDIKQALGEVHTCTPNPDLLQDFDSCNQHNTLAGSIICSDQAPQFCNSSDTKPAIAHSKSNSSDFLCNEVQPTSFQGPDTDSDMELDTDNALAVKEDLLLHVRREFDDDCQSAECSPMQPARPFHCVDEEAGAADLIDLEAVTDDSKTESHDSLTDKRQPVLSEESNAEIEFDANKLSPSEGESYVEKTKSVGKSGTNTIRKDHLKNLVPFTEEWLAVMEACGEEVLVQKTGAVQNSPTEKAAPEPSPWSPVKRKAQDVGPFDCTKYSKSVRACDTP